VSEPVTEILPTVATAVVSPEHAATSPIYDSMMSVSRLVERLDAIETRIASLTDAVNTIGAIIDNIGQQASSIYAMVEKDGLAGILGGMMGKKAKNGS
jgi:hypothetical protein